MYFRNYLLSKKNCSLASWNLRIIFFSIKQMQMYFGFHYQFFLLASTPPLHELDPAICTNDLGTSQCVLWNQSEGSYSCNTNLGKLACYHFCTGCWNHTKWRNSGQLLAWSNLALEAVSVGLSKINFAITNYEKDVSRRHIFTPKRYFLWKFWRGNFYYTSTW